MRGYNRDNKRKGRMQMKRCSRLTAMVLSLVMLLGVTFFAGAVQDDAKMPSSVQEFAVMCGK